MPILSRPPFQLRSLPIPMRWEVTRRNPYYFTLWKTARAEYRKDLITSVEDGLMREVAIPCLWMIGVSGEPPDPALPFESLDADQLKAGWLSGAVHPLTMRGLSFLLLTALPKETLAHLGRLCQMAACDDVDGKMPKNIEAIQDLATSTSPGLDNYADEPLVSINPAASERKIGEAIDLLLKEWKSRRGLEEQRVRSDKYDQYLQVWDLREGWSNGAYDRSAECTFREIAKVTKRSISTLNNQYCRAFELIIGLPYSRERWLMCLGPIKLTEIVGLAAARTQRPTKSPTNRPVPETVLSSRSKGESTRVTLEPKANNDIEVMTLLADIETMLSRGRSDEQIAAEMDLPIEAIACLRSRDDMMGLRP